MQGEGAKTRKSLSVSGQWAEGRWAAVCVRECVGVRVHAHRDTGSGPATRSPSSVPLVEREYALGGV